MMSVENFYWVLYENLLKPLGINPIYYYPFGTHEMYIEWPFQKNLLNKFDNLTQLNHVYFYFDQEPIHDQNLGDSYECQLLKWSHKRAKFLANSEHSDYKKIFCRQRGYLDWYYFYHGFAAVNWFRDSQYVNGDKDFQKVFLCFNNLVRSRRSYRLSLIAKIKSQGLCEFGDISLHATPQDINDELYDKNSYLSVHDKDIIDINLTACVPFVIDNHVVNGEFSAHFGYHELELWKRSLWHIVTETVFYEPKHHLTEKIFKPIVSMRPFFLVSSPGALSYLRSYGFQTFDKWIDESYDNEHDHDRRLNMIVNELTKLCSLSSLELHRMHQDMLPVIRHNKQHLFGDFRVRIVNELVDNFDQCIRIWNNGRVDGRELSLHPDLDGVKKILLS